VRDRDRLERLAPLQLLAHVLDQVRLAPVDFITSASRPHAMLISCQRSLNAPHVRCSTRFSTRLRIEASSSAVAGQFSKKVCALVRNSGFSFCTTAFTSSTKRALRWPISGIAMIWRSSWRTSTGPG
jgi:hypothetical protein